MDRKSYQTIQNRTVSGRLLSKLFSLVGKSARQFLTAASDIILPPRCLACDELVGNHNGLCGSCWSDMVWINQVDNQDAAFAYHAELFEELGSNARYTVRYEGTARRLITSFKYLDRPELGRPLAEWMQANGGNLLEDADVLVPVPLHRFRLLKRKYNQAAELGRHLAEAREIEFCPAVLRRIRHTKPQVGTDQSARLKNVSGAFRVEAQDRHLIAGKRVLLVDDVVTTGATVSACTRALLRAGAQSVDVLAFAVVVGSQEDTIYD